MDNRNTTRFLQRYSFTKRKLSKICPSANEKILHVDKMMKAIRGTSIKDIMDQMDIDDEVARRLIKEILDLGGEVEAFKVNGLGYRFRLEGYIDLKRKSYDR